MLVLLLLILLGVSFSFELQGKRALVTGSSGGIGAAIAKRLASEGVDVLVHYNIRRDGAIATQQAILKNGGTCSGIVQCDFRSPVAISRLFHDVIDDIWSDGLDILINNAGIVTKMALDDDDGELASWHETFQVNLHAPLQLSRLARQRMLNGGGVIVNVSSIHGERSVEYMVAYAASKAALDTLTRGLALEYASDDIRVNAIAPGVVPVERTAAAFDDPNVVDMWLPHLPVRKLGTVEQVAEATVPLCTNEWITGTVWTIDGGMLARSNMPNRPRPPVPEHNDDANVISDGVRFEKL